MPFLDNGYGEYGFHDATWRTAAQFGNVNIYSPYTDPVHGSHGCVELPLATAAWLYGWDHVGTTVTVEA
jgi:lipoprotein-anchoring transpeptidase ErfK/SrfK